MSDRGAMSAVLHYMDESPLEFPITLALTDGSKAIITRIKIKEDISTKYTIWDMK
jgi:hypothetical protein